MLYYLENAEMTECMTCGHSRYKPRTGRGKTLVAYNNGVCVKGSTSSELEVDYYGKLEEVVEVQYHSEQNRVFLFKYNWYDITDIGIRVDPVTVWPNMLYIVRFGPPSPPNSRDSTQVPLSFCSW